MNLAQLTPDVKRICERALALGHEVWLIGSRANFTNQPDSDWDILIFGNADLLNELTAIPPISFVDVLVVTDGNEFRSAWLRTNGSFKWGDLIRWKWQRISENEAHYEGTKGSNWGSTRRAERIVRT